MITEIVMSPIKDPNIKKNLNESPIWKNCYRKDEMTDEIRKKHEVWVEYHIKFDGLKPTQVIKVK